jgi:transmembrane sensor
MWRLHKKNKAMFSKNKTDWSLLAKYMAGETDEKEAQAITEWIDNNPENRDLFIKIKSDWKMMNTMNSKFNVDNAWNKLQNRIISDDKSIVNKDIITLQKPLNRYFMTPFRIAATLLLLAVLGTSLVFIYIGSQNVNITASVNERGKAVKLPDGSSVYLNANTRISYSKHFIRKSREVTLDGEAFFDVSHDKNKPFIIYTNKARIKVLGTSFNVNAPVNCDQVKVFVSTGIVELSEADNQTNHVLLRSGNIGMINHKAISSVKAENENSIAWKTGNVTFHDTRLSEVTSVLNDMYRVNIVIREPGIDTTRINGSYQDDPLDEILKVICTQNHLTVEKSSDIIYLSR